VVTAVGSAVDAVEVVVDEAVVAVDSVTTVDAEVGVADEAGLPTAVAEVVVAVRLVGAVEAEVLVAVVLPTLRAKRLRSKFTMSSFAFVYLFLAAHLHDTYSPA